MMDYSRRTKTANTSSILRLIVTKVVEDRTVDALVRAYSDELEEDWGEENGAPPGFKTTHEAEQWQRETFGMLIDHDEIDKALQAVYVPRYRSMTGSSAAQAMEVYDYPSGFPTTHVPQAVVKAVGQALAERDGTEAIALRQYAQRAR